jgi:hypothetical protein
MKHKKFERGRTEREKDKEGNWINRCNKTFKHNPKRFEDHPLERSSRSRNIELIAYSVMIESIEIP